MKILASGNKGGSSYHRLNLLKFSEHKVDFIDDLREANIPEYGLLYIRTSTVKSATLSIWKQMYGIKIIVDRDDSLIIPKDHPNYDKLKNQEDFKDLLIVADVVTTTNEELRQEFLQYNDNVFVIPNRIPYGFEQFQTNTETEEEFMKRKIRVGFVGSFYHHKDWLSIKPWLNTLVNNQWFKENCEFLMCGYDKSVDYLWKDFKSLGKFIQGKPTDSYISLYNELDIILCPLVNNDFNRKKSSLKIMEAGVSNSLCLLSPLYRDKKDFPKIGHIYIEKDKEWLTATRTLCMNKELLWEYKQETGEKAREVNYMEAVVTRDYAIDFALKTKDFPIEDNLFTIRYAPNQPFEFIPILNKVNSVEQKSWRFEYNVIVNHVPTLEDKTWTGFFSWKFIQKTHLFKKKVLGILEKTEYDCINFSRPLGHPYLKFTEKAHPGFMNLFKLICKDLELPVSEPKYTIYSNFFVLKTPLYKEYVQTVLIPALYLLENKYWDLANKDSQYKGLTKDRLKELTGLDYYNFVTFICERLIGQWVDKKKVKTLNVFK